MEAGKHRSREILMLEYIFLLAFTLNTLISMSFI